MFTIKINGKAKTASGTLGISDKRWEALHKACDKANDEADDVIQAIASAIKEMKVESNEEAIAVAYITSRMFQRNQSRKERMEALKTLIMG